MPPHPAPDLRAAIAHYEQAIAAEPDRLSHYWQLGLAWLLLGEETAAQAVWLSVLAELDSDRLATATADLLTVLEVEATRQFRVGQFSQAVAIDRQILEFLPESAPTHAHLGEALAQLGESEQAIAHWQMAVDLEPDCVEVFNSLAAVYEKLQRWEAAIAQYEAVVRLQPNSVTAHHHLGFCWGQRGHWEPARLHFHKAAQSGDEGYARLQQGDGAGAIACFRHHLQSCPAFVAAYRQWAPGSFLEALQQPQMLNQYTLLGQALAGMGDAAGAIAVYQSAIAQMGEVDEAMDPPQHRADIYFNLGRQLAALQQWQEAIQCYETALEWQPDGWEVWLELGRALTRTSSYVEAHQAYQRVHQLQPEGTDVDLHQGQTWLSQHQWQAAIAAYQSYLASHPTALEAWHNLGVALAQAGEGGSVAVAGTEVNAPACFRRVLRLNSNLAPAIAQTILHLQQQGKLDSSDVAQMLPVAPPNGFYATTQDWARQGQGDYREIHPAQTVALRSPQTPSGTIHFSFRFGAAVTLPGSCVATLPQGRFWIDPDQSSSAVITAHNQLLTDLSPEFPALSPGHPDKQPGRHWLFKVERLPPVERVEGTVVVLAGLSTDVYFHWMFDLLPRLELLRLAGVDLTAIDAWLVSDRLPFQQETLQHFQIPPHNRLQLQDHPHLQATQLIVPSPGNVAWMPPWVCEFLRQHFLPSGAITTAPKKRLYISRNQTRTRRIINEDQVIELLQTAGVQPIKLESLSVVEQARLFASAEVVIAPHGSGLTNLVFCAPGTKVVEIFSPNFVYSCYWLVSNLVGLDYYYVLGDTPLGFYFHRLLAPNPRTEDIYVNLERLRDVLRFAGIG